MYVIRTPCSSIIPRAPLPPPLTAPVSSTNSPTIPRKGSEASTTSKSSTKSFHGWTKSLTRHSKPASHKRTLSNASTKPCDVGEEATQDSPACGSSSPARSQTCHNQNQNTSSKSSLAPADLGKFDSIEYIDQTSTSPDIITNNKGYHVVDDERAKKAKPKPKAKPVGGKKKSKKEKKAASNDEDKREVVTTVRTVTTDVVSTNVVTTTTSLNR